MKQLFTTALATAVYVTASAAASAQTATPMYDAMSAKEYGEKRGLENRKLCLLALKTYDYGVKELGMGKADSKQAVRADNALPFTIINLESNTQTKVLFDRAVADVTSEFAVFKTADEKTQKRLFRAAKGPNKSCAKLYDNSELKGYGTVTKAADYITGMSSEDALICASVAVSGFSSDRASFLTGFMQFLTWDEVHKQALRREGHPSDELVESLKISDVEDKMKDVDETKALALFETCPAKYKKAKFQADLKKGEDAVVPVINWD